MAAKLARLVYRMLRYGMKYMDQGAAFYELKRRELQVQQLKWKAAKLGYKVTLLPSFCGELISWRPACSTRHLILNPRR
jgi:hypothetical protein